MAPRISSASMSGASTDDAAPSHVTRPRLEARLSSRAPITVLSGPRGCGKSELLRAFRRRAPIYFRVGHQHKSFARFVHGLAEAVAPLAPGAQASFPRAWERALQSRSPGSALAHWLCEHLQGIDRPLVLDDLHDAGADLNVAAFLAKLAELRPESPLILAVRDVGALPLALWMATRRMERPIDDRELRFDAHEAATAAEHFGADLGPAQIATLLAATGGSPIALHYALSRLRHDPRALERGTVPAGFDEITAALLDRRSSRERAYLLSAAMYPDIDDAVLAHSGWEDASALRTAMRTDGAFMWERDADGRLRFHDRFRDFLFACIGRRGGDFRLRIAERAVRSLRMAERHADALEVATRESLTASAGELLDEHGFELIEVGQVDLIGEALDLLDGAASSLGAKAIALRGYLDSRRGRLDTAEAWFRLGLESARDDRARVTIAMHYTRELSLRRRDDACDVLAPFADTTTLPYPLLVDVRSAYAQGLAAANQLEPAGERAREALAMLDDDAPAALRARVFARAAYVALECGELAVARERALIAAPLAMRESLYDVAASTYSVLYNIAYGDDDTVACLEYLHRVRDCGVKSGTLRLDLYALLGMYELYSEAGDDAALAQLDRQLAALDTHDAGVEIMEALLPAKALVAAGNGDFAAAIHLLQPTAQQYATPERRALCWAQIAVYAAANDGLASSEQAVANAQAALAQVDVTTALTEMTQLTLALAAWTAGDSRVAWRWLNVAERAATGQSRRRHALRTAVTALIVGDNEPAGLAATVGPALDQLRECTFGGMARLIERLPLPGRAGGTVGTALAAASLPDRLHAAYAAGDPRLVSAWLDELPPSVVHGLRLSEAFEEWATRHAARLAPRSLRLEALRRSLEAYAPPAPVVLRLVDDIDAAIERLFIHLDIAAPLMAEHSRAVSAWCSRVARTLGLDHDAVLFITRSGLIHDLGKMRTPPEILNAARGLTAAEWAVMKDHAAEGGRIVAEVDELRSFIPIVRGHHERLDGRGYPDGLKTGQIPLAARIVAVADSFNAMIGRRPYRGPMKPTDALAELQRNVHTQFDPEVVEAMVRVVSGRYGESFLPRNLGPTSH